MSREILPAVAVSAISSMWEMPLPLGLVAAKGVDLYSLGKRVEEKKLKVQQEFGKRSEQVAGAVQAFESFFQKNGFTYPLSAQLRRVQAQGFPAIMPAIDTLLVSEATTGILMGVQSLEKIEGQLLMGFASGGESFQGMRGRIVCQEGEVVLRDQAGIIASYFQGPDSRTKVLRDTRDLIFFIFSAPGIDTAWFNRAVEDVGAMIHEVSHAMEVRIITSQSGGH